LQESEEAMAHSLCKVYVHFVWTTKHAQRILAPSARPKLLEHFLDEAKNHSIVVEALNVQPEHVHLLTNLSRAQTIEDVAKQLKGESSHWINHNDVIAGKFSWQTGYGAFSVSYTHYKEVVAYINNQDEHHKRVTFMDEYKALLLKYGYTQAEADELARAD
jgi:REP element-mobilizing transposase RayT